MGKIVHFVVPDGTPEEIEALVKGLKRFKEDNKLDYAFLVSNSRVELKDTRVLINELYELYKQTNSFLPKRMEEKKNERRPKKK